MQAPPLYWDRSRLLVRIVVRVLDTERGLGKSDFWASSQAKESQLRKLFLSHCEVVWSIALRKPYPVYELKTTNITMNLSIQVVEVDNILENKI